MHAPTQNQSAKDMPSQTTLKERKANQGNAAELARKDFLAELEAKERKHFQLDKIEVFERTSKNYCHFVRWNFLLEACCSVDCWCLCLCVEDSMWCAHSSSSVTVRA